MPWKRERLPTPIFWPGKLHGVHGVTKSWTQLSDFQLSHTSKAKSKLVLVPKLTLLAMITSTYSLEIK